MPKDTQLHKAANQGDVDQCRRIIEEGEVEVNARGAQERTALHRAVGGDHLACAQTLVELGADKSMQDKAGRSPLHWAAIGGHEKCLEYILSLDPELNLSTTSGMTVLHAAVDSGRTECLKALIAHHEKQVAAGQPGFDFDLKDGEGNTAFDMAKARKDKLMAAMLKEKKVEVSAESAACRVM